MKKIKHQKNRLPDQTIAFIYIWRQISTGMWYLGSHSSEGCHPADGYICSSHVVLNLILNNPEDWIREVVDRSPDTKLIRDLESEYLHVLDARLDKRSYNKTNGAMNFPTSTAGTICVSKDDKEKYVLSNELAGYEQLGWTKGRSQKSRIKIGNTISRLREENPDGWTSRSGAENNKSCEWRFISPDGKEFFITGSFGKFCDEHNLSGATLSKAVQEGWIPRRGKCAGWQVFNLTTGKGTTRDTLNHGESRSGENNPYHRSKRVDVS